MVRRRVSKHGEIPNNSICIYNHLLYINAGFSSHVRWHQRVAAILEPEIHLSSFNQKITRNISEPKVFQPKKHIRLTGDISHLSSHFEIGPAAMSPAEPPRSLRRGRAASQGAGPEAPWKLELFMGKSWENAWNIAQFSRKNGAGTMGTLGRFCELTGGHGKIVGKSHQELSVLETHRNGRFGS